MSPMRRTALNVVTGLSLLACVAVAALWVRSYWYEDVIGRSWQEGSAHFNSYRGRLTGLYSNLPDRGATFSFSGRLDGTDAIPPRFLQTRWNRMGLVLQEDQHPRVQTAWDTVLRARGRRPFRLLTRHAGVPHWLIAAAFAALPAARLPGVVERCRRKRGGRCVKCGYDLRAAAGRCPECGAMPAGAKG